MTLLSVKLLTVMLLKRAGCACVLLFPLSPSQKTVLGMVLMLHRKVALWGSHCWQLFQLVRGNPEVMWFLAHVTFHWYFSHPMGLSHLPVGYRPPVWGGLLLCTVWAALWVRERRWLSSVAAASVYRCEVSSFEFFLVFLQRSLFPLHLGYCKYKAEINSQR